MKTSILTRLLLLLIVSYIPIVLILLWNNNIQQQQAQHDAEDLALQQATEIAFFHQQQIQEVQDILNLLSETQFITDWDMDVCAEVIPRMLSHFPNWSNIAVMDADATVQCSGLPDRLSVNYADRPFIQQAMDEGVVTFSGFVIGRVTGQPSFGIAKPVFNPDGSVRGIITIGLLLHVQSEFIARELLKPGYLMTIIDQNNTVLLAYSEPERWIGQTYSEDFVRLMEGQNEGTLEAAGLDNQMRLFGFSVLETAAATMLVSVDKSLAFAEVMHIQQRNLLVLALTFIVASLIIMLASHLIARPLRQFSRVTQEFAKGDLRKRMAMESHIAEITQIQLVFNDMAASIETRIEERTAALQTEIENRKQVEAELERLATRLRESNQDLEQFAFVASHDLREPLRKVGMFSEQLQKGNLDEERRQDYLKRLRDAAERMTLLIDNLLLYARLDQQRNTQTEVDLTALVENTIIELAPLIKETQGSIHVSTLPTIRADSIQMQRLFQNLIANALKYHQECVPPVVHITMQEDDQHFQIRIQDNGVGIAEKDAERVFKIFERLHGRSEGGGAGLGLAICRKIVQYHGGTIAVESTVGEGSTFILSFPIILKVLHQSQETI